MTNEELYEKAKNAIIELFSDRSVSARTTLENLNSLVGEISILAEALSMDSDREDE